MLLPNLLVEILPLQVVGTFHLARAAMIIIVTTPAQTLTLQVST